MVAAGIMLGAGPVISGDGRQPGQEPKIEGDLKAMQGQWISKDGQGMESVWKFKAEHVSLKTPTRAYEMTHQAQLQGRAREAHRFRRLDGFAQCQGVQGPGDLQVRRRRDAQDLLQRRRFGTAQGVQDRLREIVLFRPEEKEMTHPIPGRASRPGASPVA